MIQTATYQSTYRSTKTMNCLNRNKISDRPSDKTIKAMGMAACQGLCITYGLHSKRFCK